MRIAVVGVDWLPDGWQPESRDGEGPFLNNEGTFFELGGCYRRYHAPLSRTVYLGKPPQKFLDVVCQAAICLA